MASGPAGWGEDPQPARADGDLEPVCIRAGFAVPMQGSRPVRFDHDLPERQADGFRIMDVRTVQKVPGVAQGGAGAAPFEDPQVHLSIVDAGIRREHGIAAGIMPDVGCHGKLHALITQNIDGLHLKAGSSPGLVIEVHGNVHKVMCLDCGWRGPFATTRAWTSRWIV